MNDYDFPEEARVPCPVCGFPYGCAPDCDDIAQQMMEEDNA